MDVIFRNLIAEADAWIENLRPLLGSDQSKMAARKIDTIRSSGFPHRNWKKYLLQSLCTGNELSVWNQQFQFVNLNDAVVLFDEIYLKDVYGLNAITSVQHVLDTGASNGFFALSVLKKFPEAFVTCVEPNPYNIKLLKMNLKTFVDSGNVEIIPKALHSDSGKASLFVPKENNIWGGLGASIVSRARTHERENETVEIDAVALYDLINKPIDFFKCDIEGLEFEAIKSGGNRIQNCSKILIEIHADVHNFENKFNELLNFLVENNFRYSAYDGATNCCDFLLEKPAPSFMLCAVRK